MNGEQENPEVKFCDDCTKEGTANVRTNNSAEGTKTNSCLNVPCKLWHKLTHNITLEPMLFMKMVAEGNYKVVADTLEIERVCQINLNYTLEECKLMDDGNHTSIQVEVQKYQNLFNLGQNWMDSLLPLLVIIFAGSLSDRYGRKPPMLIVVAGFIVTGLLHTLVSAMSNWPVEVLYLPTFCVDATGSWVVFNMAVYSYIADVTEPATRAKRLAVLDAVWYAGGPVGTLLGGWLYHVAGYEVVFLTSAGLWFICFVYILFVVKESIQRNVANETENGRSQEEENVELRDARWGPLRHVIALGRTAFRRRSDSNRIKLVMLVGLKLAIFFVQGHQVYLWSRRVLGWDATKYSTFAGADEALHQVGMVLFVGVASYVCLHDSVVAIGGLISIALWSAILATILGPAMWWFVIIASVAGSFEGSIEPALRSMLTATVNPGEVGKVLAFLGLLEALWLSVDSTLFTALYNIFVETFPQINFVVQASCSVVCIFIVLLLRRFYIRPDTQLSTQINEHSHCL